MIDLIECEVAKEQIADEDSLQYEVAAIAVDAAWDALSAIVNTQIVRTASAMLAG